MPNPHRRRTPQSVLQRYALTRARQKAWRERPDHMEQIRKRATDRAKTIKEGKNIRFTEALKALPETMTTQELHDLFLTAYLSSKQVTKDSFFKRVKRRGLLAYDPAQSVWLNLSRLTSSAG